MQPTESGLDMDIKPFTLVLGGAASGKSLWAETHVMGTERPRIYLATADNFNDEMDAKIARHKTQRGTDWTTVETPLGAADALNNAPANAVVLFDCATLWLGNHLHMNSDIDAELDRLLAALAACVAPVVVVSNELGHGLVPADQASRDFRDRHGRMNQRLAAAADRVVMITAGLAQILKDTP